MLTSKATGELMLAIANSGGGLAQSAGFAGLSKRDGLRASGHFGDGFLRPGERVLVRLQMPGFTGPNARAEGIYALASCRDTREFIHAWSDLPRHIVFRTRLLRRPRYPEADEVFAQMFPGVDSTGSQPTGFKVEGP